MADVGLATRLSRLKLALDSLDSLGFLRFSLIEIFDASVTFQCFEKLHRHDFGIFPISKKIKCRKLSQSENKLYASNSNSFSVMTVSSVEFINYVPKPFRKCRRQFNDIN